MSRNLKVYDIESYINYFSVIFKEYKKNIYHTFRIFTHNGKIIRHDGQKIRNFVKSQQDLELIGYNNLHYDRVMLYAVVTYPNISPKKLNDLSKLLITDREKLSKDQNDMLYNMRYNNDITWKTIDCMKTMGFDKLGISLKMCAIHLTSKKIQDLPIPFDHVIKPNEDDVIILYNKNDVDINEDIYDAILDEITLREDVSEFYGVDVRNQSRSGMANKLLTDIYEQESGISKKELRTYRTTYTSFKVKDCIGRNISFKSSILKKLLNELEQVEVGVYSERVKELLKRLKVKPKPKRKAYKGATGLLESEVYEDSTKDWAIKVIDNVNIEKCPDAKLRDLFKNIQRAGTLDEKYKLIKQIHHGLINNEFMANKFSYAKTVTFDGTTYNLGVGGLHSKDAPGEFVSDDKVVYRDADVTSYYPFIMINNRLCPAHLDANIFIEVFLRFVTDRIEAKALQYTDPAMKLKAEALKILINSIFGKLGSEYFWLQDQKILTSVTVSGQLYLLMLVEMLAEKGIHTISANTDGIVCKIPVEKEDVYYQTCKEWETRTDFTLEYNDYQHYIRRDVNNYITVKVDDGKTPLEKRVKEKGIFATGFNLSKGYTYPIVSEALRKYFVYGTPVMDTLRECTNISKFCMSQKAGRQYGMEFHTINGTIEELQKTNRYFVINKSEGALFKRHKTTNKLASVLSKQSVSVINDIDDTIPITSRDVNLKWYEAEINKTLEVIRPLATKGTVQLGFGF